MKRTVTFSKGDIVVAMVPSHMFAVPLYGEVTEVTKTTIHVRWDTLAEPVDEVVTIAAARRDGWGVIGPDGKPQV